MFYLTPAQLRAMDLGVKLDDLTDRQLSRWIHAASLAVNTHTNQSNLPQPHDFRGGTVVGETHTWPIDPYEREVRRRVFPYHLPIIEVTQVRIYATLTQYLELDADEIYYEPTEGWIEPASANMTSYGLFGAAMLPYVGLAHPHVSLNYTYGSRFPTSERIYYAEEGGHTWRANQGFWSADPVSVQVNGSVRPGTDYTVDRIEGTVTFVANLPVDGDVVDVAYVGTLHPNISLATGMTAVSGIVEKGLSLSGLGGLRSIRVAELAIERDIPRNASAANTPTVVTVPPEAAGLLDEFVHHALAFG